MMNPWTLSALSAGLALIATLLAIRFRSFRVLIPTGTVAQLVNSVLPGAPGRRCNPHWTKFRSKWDEALLVILPGIFRPFAAFRLEFSNRYPTAILIPCRQRGCECADSRCGCDRILPSPASFRREVTRIRAHWRSHDGTRIGGRDGKPCFCRISENSGGL